MHAFDFALAGVDIAASRPPRWLGKCLDHYVIICYCSIMNEIKWHNRARKQMKRIPRNYQKAIHEKVDRLENFPEDNSTLDITRLSNHNYDYRMRVGRYRVLFDHDEAIKIIAIQEVKKRDERTYGPPGN